MKGAFVVVLLAVALLAGSFVAYGVYLNRVSASYVESVRARRVVAVAAAPVRRRDFRPRIALDGVHLQTETMTDIVCQVDGTLEDLLVGQGDMVEKGQKVCLLDNPLLPIAVSRAEAEVKKAEVNSANAAIGLERAENLRRERAISQSELDAARTGMLAAEAEELAARASLADARERFAFREVGSGMRGEVLLVYQKEGSHLDYGTPVMLVGDFSSLVFSINIPDEAFSNLLPLEKEYEFVVELVENDKGFTASYAEGFGRDVVFKAAVAGFSPPLDQPAAFRAVKWNIDNRLNALEPGVYANVLLRRPSPVSALLVPDIAVLPGGGAVFVVTPEGRLDKRDVRTGRTDGEDVEIVEGLREGDMVIESNVSDLRIGDAVSASLSEGNEP